MSGSKMLYIPEEMFKGKKITPPLEKERRKGHAGRIGVFGGNENTGAAYLAGISALKVGADECYIFCTKEAAPVIKSYSPELIVLPVVDDPEIVEKLDYWLDKLDVVLLGPGFGMTNTLSLAHQIIKCCWPKRIPMIIDGDVLVLLKQKPKMIKNYPAPIILTPNMTEFMGLMNPNGDNSKFEMCQEFFNILGDNITIISKGPHDEVITKTRCFVVTEPGSGRRCGGQGTILAGILATFLAWATATKADIKLACYSACVLTRNCNARAFAVHGRSMLASDMIKFIYEAFQEKFELP